MRLVNIAFNIICFLAGFNLLMYISDCDEDDFPIPIKPTFVVIVLMMIGSGLSIIYAI
jgi:hypothetical protein